MLKHSHSHSWGVLRVRMNWTRIHFQVLFYIPPSPNSIADSTVYLLRNSMKRHQTDIQTTCDYSLLWFAQGVVYSMRQQQQHHQEQPNFSFWQNCISNKSCYNTQIILCYSEHFPYPSSTGGNISRGFPVHNFRMIYCSDLNLGLCLSFANKTERVPATATGSFNNSEREIEIDNWIMGWNAICRFRSFCIELIVIEFE